MGSEHGEIEKIVLPKIQTNVRTRKTIFASKKTRKGANKGLKS